MQQLAQNQLSQQGQVNQQIVQQTPAQYSGPPGRSAPHYKVEQSRQVDLFPLRPLPPSPSISHPTTLVFSTGELPRAAVRVA